MKYILENEGRVWLRGALNESDLGVLDQWVPNIPVAGMRLEPSRNVTRILGSKGPLKPLFEASDHGLKPVRFLYFNKSHTLNWSLPWHQDRVIAVSDKVKRPDFKNWSQKAGVWHCEPPENILKDMIFARVHLDDASDTHGALELALGSHKSGCIASRDIPKIVGQCSTEICTAKRGDILIVKALTLHRSRASNTHAPRRTLRIDLSAAQLPSPLSWKYTHI